VTHTPTPKLSRPARPAAGALIAALFLPLFLSLACPGDSGAAIRLLARTIEPNRLTVAEDLAAAAPGHAVLVFDRQEREAAVRRLERRGVVFHQYLPDDAFAVTLPEDLGAGEPAAGIAGVLRLAPEDKVHPSLLRRGIDAWARDSHGRALLNVRFYPDVTDGEARRWLTARGASILGWLPPHHRYTVAVPAEGLLDLASGDGVRFVDEIAPPVTLENDGSRALIHADQAQGSPYGLSGADIDVAVIDGGRIDPDHPDFAGRLTLVDNASISDHSTHVAGTVGGTGLNSVLYGGGEGQWRGMAPGCRLYSFTYTDHLSKYPDIVNTYGAEITNNSWGRTVDQDNCEDYGDYRFGAPELDEIVTGLHGLPISIVFSGGNERNDCDCGMSCTPPYINYGNVNPPKTAKNVLVVGALNSDDGSMTTFSSWGPVDDGRIRPDVVAAGDEVGGDHGIKSCSPGGGYAVKTGTSMSCPAATGASALLMEHYRQVHGQQPLPSTVRGLLMHSAVDQFNPGPDFRTGYGLIDLFRAIQVIDGDDIRLDAVDQNDFREYSIPVDPGTETLQMTIAWDDPPGAEGAEVALVNDLDLELVSPSQVTYYPWVLDPANPEAPAGTGFDRLNNVEQVRIDQPESGTWTARVRGFNVPLGPQLVSIFGVGEEVSAVGGPSGAVRTPAPLALRVGPNPAKGSSGVVTLRFRLPAPGTARLRVLDASGRLMRTLFDGSLAAGEQVLTWDGRDESGQPVPSGVYLLEAEAAGTREGRPLVVTR